MDLLRFVLIGIGAGALYGLIAQGLVLAYRGSGILNFAQGSFVMVGAYSYYQVTEIWGMPLLVGIAAAPVLGAVIGMAVQVMILSRMNDSSAVLRVVATLAVMAVLQATAVLIYGVDVLSVRSALPTEPVSVLGALVGADRLLLFGIGLLMTLGLWSLYKFTKFGRVTAAVAENQLVAASLGHSPYRIAMINWGASGAIAALAGALLAPITFLQPTTLTLLVIPALAVGLIANYQSFPVVFLAALGLGVLESLTGRYVTITGVSASLPFLIVILVMVGRGRGLPLRSHIVDRWPSVTNGRVRWVPTTIFASGLAYCLNSLFPYVWVNAFTVTICFAALCMSIVFLTGFAGQLSLAQFALAGLGALTTALLMSERGWNFGPAGVAAILSTMAVGLLVGIPALRTRGINLAIVTLGLGVVLYNMVLNNGDVSGGASGIRIDQVSVVGVDLRPLLFPERYAVFALVLVLLVAIGVLNLRRGATGRSMLAVRSNERAAAALGINVFEVKLYAFSVAAGIAAVAGILLAFRNSVVVAEQFGTFQSITAVGNTVVGGVGFVGGGVMGASLIPGGVGSEIFANVSGIDPWLPLVSGLVLLTILVTQPSGLWQVNVHAAKSVASVVFRTVRRAPRRQSQVAHKQRGPAVPQSGNTPKAPQTVLRITDAHVAFGGVVAVDDVSFEVRTGEVLGLIGPNGAGKTTVIDLCSGFVRLNRGRIRLNDMDISTWSARRRARNGLRRSFQSVELFEELTIRENLAVASGVPRRWRYLLDAVAPGRITLDGPALAAAEEFGLVPDLDRMPAELSLGRRRLASIAQTVASSPSIILLDEPAAGLGDAEASHLAHLVRRLASQWGMGVVLVEHNVDMVLTACDRVTVLAAGSVLASGSPHEIRSDKRVLSTYLGGDSSTRQVGQSETPVTPSGALERGARAGRMGHEPGKSGDVSYDG